jgi:hypothetical protein
MASVNKKAKAKIVKTHGGAPTFEEGAKQQLERAVMTCMLWENAFYEDGVSIADRIVELIPKVKAKDCFEIAVRARTKGNMRHVPLLIARTMANIDGHKALVGKLLPEIILRPDELTEFLSIYWKDGKQPLSGQVKKGLAEAFKRFNEYSLAKYNQKDAIKLRDVLFLCHAEPKDIDQGILWKKLIGGFCSKCWLTMVSGKKTKCSCKEPVEAKLSVPDTWEVELSAKGNKKEVWERLLTEKKLGGMALLRNLRNMVDQHVDTKLIESALDTMKGDRILPFRYLTATTHAPSLEPAIERAFLRSLEGRKKIPGKTILIVDVSGSMYGQAISAKSEVDRAKAACSLAAIVREVCEKPVIYATAGNDGTRVHETQLVPARRGFSLIDAIYKLCKPLGGGGIFLNQVMKFVKEKELDADRIIVITDEQDCAIDGDDAPSQAPAFGSKANYIINVNVYKNGIGQTGKWTKINGWSESVMDYIEVSEGSSDSLQ